MGYLPYQLVQDFFDQQFDGWKLASKKTWLVGWLVALCRGWNLQSKTSNIQCHKGGQTIPGNGNSVFQLEILRARDCDFSFPSSFESVVESCIDSWFMDTQRWFTYVRHSNIPVSAGTGTCRISVHHVQSNHAPPWHTMGLYGISMQLGFSRNTWNWYTAWSKNWPPWRIPPGTRLLWCWWL